MYSKGGGVTLKSIFTILATHVHMRTKQYLQIL